jgi:hypothetical protein
MLVRIKCKRLRKLYNIGKEKRRGLYRTGDIHQLPFLTPAESRATQILGSSRIHKIVTQKFSRSIAIPGNRAELPEYVTILARLSSAFRGKH